MISEGTDAHFSTSRLCVKGQKEREKEKERKRKEKMSEKESERRISLLFALNLTIKVIHTFLKPFLVNSTSGKCNRLHLNALKVF